MSCESTRAMLDRAFVTGRADLLAKARAHAEECEACRAVYDGMFAADAALAALGDRDPALGESEKGFVGAMAGLGQTPERPSPRRLWLLGGSTAAAAGLAILVIALAIPAPPMTAPTDNGLTVRGGDTDAAAAAVGRLGLRVLCMTEDAGGGVRVSSVERGDGAPMCHGASALGFTVRNETGARQHLQIVVTAGGRARQLYPGTNDDSGIGPGPNETPLDVVFPLADVSAGYVRVDAAFSDKPLSPGRLVRAVDVDGTDSLRGLTSHRVRLKIEVER